MNGPFRCWRSRTAETLAGWALRIADRDSRVVVADSLAYWERVARWGRHETESQYVQVGTWLLPEAYGPNYDHFTETRMDTVPGRCVALYAKPADVPQTLPQN